MIRYRRFPDGLAERANKSNGHREQTHQRSWTSAQTGGRVITPPHRKFQENAPAGPPGFLPGFLTVHRPGPVKSPV